MELNVKIWLTRNGETVFGRGRAELLKAIDADGSISAAARRLGMSYRHAWTMLRTSEQRMGRPLLQRSKGGAGGGGARLTDLGRTLVEKFAAIDAEFRDLAREKGNELQGIAD